MEIIADGLAKRYRTHWVFRDMSLTIPSGSKTGITGPNGSGKSTLLKVLSGALPPSQGKVRYLLRDREIPLSDIFRYVSFAAPYVDLIDEMTVAESVQFHRRFRKLKGGLDLSGVLEALGGHFRATTAIHEMSSGMKQRMRLVLALCSEAEILLLDEPTTNLDDQGQQWFHSMLNEWCGPVTLLIASNDAADMAACTNWIRLPDYAPPS